MNRNLYKAKTIIKKWNLSLFKWIQMKITFGTKEWVKAY